MMVDLGQLSLEHGRGMEGKEQAFRIGSSSTRRLGCFLLFLMDVKVVC